MGALDSKENNEGTPGEKQDHYYKRKANCKLICDANTLWPASKSNKPLFLLNLMENIDHANEKSPVYAIPEPLTRPSHRLDKSVNQDSALKNTFAQSKKEREVILVKNLDLEYFSHERASEKNFFYSHTCNKKNNSLNDATEKNLKSKKARNFKLFQSYHKEAVKINTRELPDNKKRILLYN